MGTRAPKSLWDFDNILQFSLEEHMDCTRAATLLHYKLHILAPSTFSPSNKDCKNLSL